MNKIFINIKFIYSTLLIIFSFIINYTYANIGVFPIDTFAFFDTAYNILIDRHPFKDIWVTTGPLVDYFQAFLFKILGLNWQSYIIHGSIINSFITIYFFLTLVNFKLNLHLSFLYALALGILCYTISGTPFAYIHSYVFSLLSILIFYSSVKFKSSRAFFFLPISMSLAFLSMQNPSTFINFLILIFLLVFFLRKENRKFIYPLIAGSLTMLIVLILFFFITEIPLIKFYQQYILFPLTMGEYRVSGSDMAHISLSGRFTFRNIIGHFKFINFFIILLIFFTIKDFLKKKISFENLIINISLMLFGIALIFNQLITSNQTFIFSFIPFIAGLLHQYLKERGDTDFKIQTLILVLMVFSIIKYHFEYNEKRKFMDLQNVNLKKAINANFIDEKFEGLRWITPKFSTNINHEGELLKEAIDNIKKDKKKKLLMTNYQFFSLITGENLHIPNRWYTHDNNSYPLDNHKYFQFYKQHINGIIKKNNIEVVYTIGSPDFKNFKIFLKDICYSTSEINEITKNHELKKC